MSVLAGYSLLTQVRLRANGTPGEGNEIAERLYPINEVAERFGLSVAALRYYEEIGVVRSTARRGRVRQYDRAALERLAYAQLWHEDAMMTLPDTQSAMRTRDAGERHELITAQREAAVERLRTLRRAIAVLDHLLDCPQDDPMGCPVTGAYLRARVDAALDGVPFDEDFLLTGPDRPETPPPQDRGTADPR